MRRVFLIISLLCLMPFAMMAQTRDVYHPEVDELEALTEGYAYAFQILDGPEGSFVKFDLNASSLTLNELKHYAGMKITAAEMVPYNSTKDFVYAYATADGIDGMFCLVDPVTGELTVIADGVEPMTEMAYDPTTKTMYGLQYGVLYTIDVNNGTATVINEMQTGSNNWVALAIDNDGVMYAINNTFSNENASLYRINTSNWNSTLIGTVPYRTQYAQTMAFDRDENELYWWQTSVAGSNLLKVNPEDATCTVIWGNNGKQMAGLMFRNKPEMFNITYETVENGVFSGPVEAAANDVVTIEVTPAEGYRLGTLTWNGNAIDIEAGAPYTFTMPEEDVTVTGSFLLSLHNIIVLDPVNGTLATEPADQGLYPNMINVIPTPDPGFGMGTITWSANGVDNQITAEPYQFPMPDYDVTVSAEYVQTGVNTLSIADNYVGYFNETVTVAVDLANENLVAGAQMDIALGENLTFTEGSLALSDRAEGEGWVITSEIKTGNILRVTVFNTGLAYFAGNEGTIFTFDVTCAPVISMNPLTFSNVVVGTPDATNLVTATVNGNVEIKDVVMNQPENVIVCNGAPVAAIEFTLDESNEEGEASFAWVNDNPAIGLDAEGTGNIAEFNGTNTTYAAIVANITVTPSLTVEGVTHVGTPKTFTITVLPQPVMDPVENIVTCSTGETMTVEFTSPVTDGTMDYAWQCDNAVFGLTAEGSGNISFTATNETNEAIVANITVTPAYTNGENTCLGEEVTFSVTVYPAVVMNAVESIATCSTGETMNIEFTSPITDGTMTYAWTSDNAILGLETEGTGNISFVATNEGTEMVTANFTVIPTYTNGETVCTGEGVSFTVTVLPVVVMDAVNNIVTCDESAVAVEFNTTITDGTMSYAWTNDNPAIGLEGEGTGNIAFTAVNTTADAVVANISVIPTYTNGELSCVGEAITFTVTVYPATTVDPVADQTVYSRESTEAIFFSAPVNDYEQKVIFNWTNDNPAIGLAASGTGNIPSFITAGSNVEQVAHITVVPVYNGEEHSCEGAAYTFTITVLPTYLVVINDAIQNGTLVDNARVSALGEHYAPAGEEITLVATPDEDYFVDYVTVTDLETGNIVVPFTGEYTFTMPEFDVLCNANFIDANNLSIQPGILDMGYRPINAWMYSKFFDVNNISESEFNVTEIQLTNYDFMVLDPIALPFAIEAGASAQVGINTNYKNVTPGLYSAIMALKGEQSRKPYLRNIVATAYTPVEPDVWELATNVTTFPFVSTQATEGTIYNNYQLPGETPDGYDGVYKIVVDHDVIVSAAVTAGADPKIAIYPNGFKGVGGPHTNNYYGAAEEIPNAATVGTGTLTSNYMPYDTYYKYSVSQMLFTAEELAAAGLKAGQIKSIEFASNSTNGYTRNNLKVYMKNANFNELTANSVMVDPTSKVFEGSMTQEVGWNKFQFNGAEFVWDGTSNILVTVLMNEGAYTTSTPWLCSNAGFNAAAYSHRDSNPYYPDAETYSMTATATRPNVKFNGVGSMTEGVAMGDEPIVNLGLGAGTYYIVASSTSEDSYTVEINVEDMPLPLPPTVIYPAHESNGIVTPTTFEYELGQYTKEYQILLGTSYNSQEVVLDWTSNLSNTFDAGDLLHNMIYYWRINERNDSGVTEGPLWIFTTELNMPLNLTVVDDELFEGEDVAVFNWDTPADRTLIGYNLYKDGVKVNEELITENTYTLEGLTYNMEGYDFNVTAVWTEGESAFSNTVNVLVSGFGTVNGHVYEQDGTTGIADATVTIIGFDEFDDIQAFEFTTDANGYYSGNVYAGYWFGMAAKEGYQTAGDNTGFELEYQGTHPNYNFILNEEYTPVTRVVAEEIDANQVHVYWGWDMIEDFESGTLTAYDWVNDATYPWVLTTTSPYEGTYCIKSSNEGVNSSTSAIQITMMVANDGLINFFAKASSENSYDKGQFFIDDVAKATMSGNTGWVEKEYPITAGMHTFKWAYTKDGSLSSNDDCFYVDYINFWKAAEPVPEGQIVVDFESGIPSNWTTIDADGDGYNWGLISESYPSDGGHESDEAAYSFSWSASSGALQPDNYLVSPQIELGGSVTFWANNHSTSYLEYVGVAVSTTGNTNPADFTTIWSSTVDAKGVTPMTRDEGAKIGEWHQFTVDLSAYAGQNGYIAIRHYNTNNMWGLIVDDISIYEPSRAFTNYNVYRKNLSTGATEQQLATGITEEEYDDNAWGSAPAGVYQWGVSANYAGNRDGESPITWSNKIDKNMVTNVTVNVSTNSGDPVTGAVVTLTNTSEPGLNLVYTTTLEENGTYSWDNFRKGTYNVSITLEGFDDLAATATIWEPTTLSYVLTETIANIDELYVSTTGWAMFGEIPSTEPPAGAVTIKLTHGDNWGDGSGYQMLLDADATAFGNEIPTSGALTSSCSGTTGLYDAFEYRLPEDAEPSCSTQSIVINNTVTITIPAGTYDWMITNPTPGDRIWIASAQGNVGGRQDDYVFEAGKTYEFTVTMEGSNDATNVTITDGNKNVYANTFAPLACGEVKDIADVVTVDNGYVVLPANNRAVEYYNVKLDGIMEGTTTLPFFQHNVTNLVEGESYTTAVQKVYTTGESEWTEFNWVYTACDNYAGLPSEPTAQWSGEDVILNWTLPAGGDGPTPPPVDPTGLSEGFENGIPSDWAIIDADGDGYNWMQSSVMMSGYSITPHSGEDMVSSASYYGGTVLYPDNYLVTPQVVLGGTFSFWACAQDASYAAEKFGVAVSTGSQTNASDFTTLQSWTMTAKGSVPTMGITRSETRATGNYYQYTVDLSAYAGQTGYIAIRHFDCSDMFYLNVDDVELSAANKGNRDLTEGFESGIPSTWAIIDADGDGYNWMQSSVMMSGYSITPHSGEDMVSSASYYGGTVLYPDNYLVTPQVTLGGTFSFWACAQDASYAAEKFGVAVSTTSQTNASSFTTLQSWTMTAKGVTPTMGITRSETRATGNYYQYTVDLSAYAGQTGYIAIRHYDCSDMFYLNVDDVEYTSGGTGPIDPPTPSADVLGVQIFRDGEWIAQVEAPATTYTDLAVESASEYTFRVYYDGDTEDYMYYRMSCPQSCGIDEDPCKAPENLAGTYVWNTYNDFGALITWTYGDFGTWLYYDAFVEGETIHIIGENNDAVSFEWANMYPASSLAAGTVLTKVASIGFDANSNPVAGIYTLKVYFGGDNAPETLIYTQDYAFDPANQGAWFEITLDNPVVIDPSANLWIALYNDGTNGHLHYPAAFTESGTGGINGRWFNEDNTGWDDIGQYISSVGAWIIRGYVTNAEKGGETVAIPANSSNANGQGSHNFSVCDATITMPAFNTRSAKEPTSFNVYRNGSLIANVDYHAESGMYEYFDNVAIGNYQYQVTALYADCESGYALTPDLSMDYVEVGVTDVNEISSITKLYPNPTTGNVMIEASGMTHITVVSTLGQVLYDANISGDMYELNLSQYNAGLYLVRIASENGVSVKRVTLVK